MSYDLKSVKAPRLAGYPLRVVVRMLENPASRPALLPQLLREAGIERFRGKDCPAPPTLYPEWPPGKRMRKGDADATLAAVDEAAYPETPGFRFATSADYARAYREGMTDPDEVAERVIAAIRKSNRRVKPLRAVIDCDEEDLREQAAAATARLRAGKARGLLDGVPVAVKDELDVAGYRTRVGTIIYGNEPAGADAAVVARLREAGALIIGKTNMHEIGIGVTGLNPHYGVARNPYGPDCHTGGSSSGSGAAVAAGLCPIAVGADGGGSIRIPAALCGVSGIKSTFGRVSGHGAAPLDWSVAHIGPLAASVTDLAVAYAVMAGPDAADPGTRGQPPVHLDRFTDGDLSGVRLGIYDPWFRHADGDVVNACQDVVDDLCAQGAERVAIEIPDLDAIRVAHAITIASEMAVNVGDAYERDCTRFGLDVRISLALARSLTSRDYIRAQRVRTGAMRSFAAALETCDVIVTPTTGCAAPSIRDAALPDGESDLSTLTEIMRFATPGNLTGLPALTLPAGYDHRGLPAGVQFTGRPWAEDLLFRVARAAELGVERRQPRVHYRILD